MLRTILLAAAALAVVALLWRFIRRRRRAAAEQPILSLVLLLRNPGTFSPARLISAINRATGKSIPLDAPDDAPEFLIYSLPTSLARLDDHMYMINQSNELYTDKSYALGVPDNRLRAAIEEHSGWCSIDLIRPDGDIDSGAVYQVIGKIAAELLDENCTGLYAPELGRLSGFDHSLVEVLRSESPLDIFGSRGLSPVVSVAEDDPEMMAAVAEAAEQFPEFAQAFANRQEGQHFGAKAAFTSDGVTEFMWVTVTDIRGDEVTGTLDNAPQSMITVRAGQTMSFRLDDLNDWMIIDGDSYRGGFTLRVLQEKLGGQILPE